MFARVKKSGTIKFCSKVEECDGKTFITLKYTVGPREMQVRKSVTPEGGGSLDSTEPVRVQVGEPNRRGFVRWRNQSWVYERKRAFPMRRSLMARSRRSRFPAPFSLSV